MLDERYRAPVANATRVKCYIGFTGRRKGATADVFVAAHESGAGT